jgi:hypothetical protein
MQWRKLSKTEWLDLETGIYMYWDDEKEETEIFLNGTKVGIKSKRQPESIIEKYTEDGEA